MDDVDNQTSTEGTDEADGLDTGAIDGAGADDGGIDADATGSGVDDADADGFKAITSQDQLNKVLAGRLQRKEDAVRRELAKDTEDAAKWREYEDSKKDENTRTAEERDALRKENEELKRERLVNAVATEKRLPPKLAARLRGATREELEADADDLLEGLPSVTAPPGGGKPNSTTAKSESSGDGDDVFDPRALVASIPRY